MTKAEFVEALANTLNQTKSESERVLEAVVDVLKQALQRGEKIDLRGLGVFKVRETKPRQARNPRTGEALSGVRGYPSPPASRSCHRQEL